MFAPFPFAFGAQILAVSSQTFQTLSPSGTRPHRARSLFYLQARGLNFALSSRGLAHDSWVPFRSHVANMDRHKTSAELILRRRRFTFWGHQHQAQHQQLRMMPIDQQPAIHDLYKRQILDHLSVQPASWFMQQAQNGPYRRLCVLSLDCFISCCCRLIVGSRFLIASRP